MTEGGMTGNNKILCGGGKVSLEGLLEFPSHNRAYPVGRGSGPLGRECVW